MNENKKGFLGQTIYRPNKIDDPSEEKEMPRTKNLHHEGYLDQYPNY